MAKECASAVVALRLAEQVRMHLFENSIEPAMLEVNTTAFALVLAAKVIFQIDAPQICDRNNTSHTIFRIFVFRV